MAKYLKQHGRAYYFRIAVPAHLRPHFKGKSEIVESLGTRDFDIAKAKAYSLAHEHLMRFRALEGSEDIHQALARQEYERTRREALEGGYRVRMDPDDEDTLPGHIRGELLGIQFEIDKIVDEEAPRRGIRVHNGDALPEDMQARLDALNHAHAELTGTNPEPLAKYEPTFKELGDQWLKQWKARPGRRESNTAKQYASTIRLFSDWWGPRPIRGVRGKDGARFIEEVLKRLPPSYARSEAKRALPLRELLAASAEGPVGLSVSSINRHARTLKAIWTWARKLGYCAGDNPFDGLNERITKNTQKGYLAWEIDELKRLLNPPPKRQDLHELMLVGMFSAMRIDEAAGLTWERIQEDPSGIWYFHVADAKTQAGMRKIPAHSKLGWLVERRKKIKPEREAERVWPRFNSEGPGKKPGADASRLFSSFKWDRGFETRRKTFHSFRKNVTRIMEDHSIPANQWARIIGHEPGFTYGVYNPAGLSMKRMREIVELIDYPGLDLPEPKGAPGARPRETPGS